MVEEKNILANSSKISSLTLYRGMNCSWGKKLYTEGCSSKGRSGIVWLLAGVWQLKGVGRHKDKGRCPLRLGEEEVKHTLLDCWETRSWRLKFLNTKLLNVNKEVAYRKMLVCTNKDQLRNVGRYLDTVKCKWFNKTK